MTPKETAAAEAGEFVAKLNDAILFPIIALLFGVALLWFVYGCAVYILNAQNEASRTEGKKHIMYGIIGLVVMTSAYAILSIAAGTFGLNKNLDCATKYVAGCENVFNLPGGGATPPGSGPGGGATPPGDGGGGATPPGGG